jgi:tetrathionate reductase subunit B
MAPKYAMGVDLDRCQRCYSCVVVCKAYHDVTVGVSWKRVLTIEPTVMMPKTDMAFLPLNCNQCDNPPCMEACPVNAISKRPDGVVIIDQNACIGCKYCAQACPYGEITIASGKASKCIFCIDRVELGLEPACVRNCVGKAFMFGNINDPNSEMSQWLQDNDTFVLRPELKTGPQVYYKGSLPPQTIDQLTAAQTMPTSLLVEAKNWLKPLAALAVGGVAVGALASMAKGSPREQKEGKN